MKKKIILILVLLAVVAYGIIQFWQGSRLKLTGTLEMTEHSLGAHAAGRLEKLLVDEGDTVKQGDSIATLDRYDQAKRDFERAKEILSAGGMTQQAYEEAQLALQDQEIRTPVDGVVLLKVREAGEVLAAGSPVVIVGDTSLFWVKVFVPEGLINRIQMNQPAVLKFDGITNTFRGHVGFIAPRAEFTPRNVQTAEERVTQTFAVKIILDEKAAFLRPGVTAEASLDLNERK